MQQSFSVNNFNKIMHTNIKKSVSDSHLASNTDIINALKVFKNFKTDVMSKYIIDKKIPYVVFPSHLQYKFIDSPEYYPLLWEDIKKNSPLNPVHLYILEKFGLLRKKIVNDLIESSIRDAKCQSDKCGYESVGSDSLTSDYDINLTSDRPNVNSMIIKIFNRKFFKVFGETSQKVFDTNIYGIGFLHNPKKILPSETDYNSQIIFAFRKLIMLEKRTKRKFFIEFPELNKYKYYYNKAKKMKPVKKNYTQLLTDIQQFTNYKPISMFIENADEKLLYDLKEKISLANMKADETYFTQGAFLHVVSHIQGRKIKIKDISRNDFIISCIENLIDILKEYSLYSELDTSDIFLSHSYKYIYRFYHAAFKAKLTNNKALLQLFKKLDYARKKKDNTNLIEKLNLKLNKEINKYIDKKYIYPLVLRKSSIKSIPLVLRRVNSEPLSRISSVNSEPLSRISSVNSEPLLRKSGVKSKPSQSSLHSPHYYMTFFIYLFINFNIP